MNINADSVRQKVIALIKAIIILPGSVVIFIPGLILYATHLFYPLCGLKFPSAWIPLIAGLFFIIIGLFFAIWTVSLFFEAGDGTPAPWNPPQHFVVKGPYAHVRNPMILSVLAIIVGEAILTGSLPILIWCITFWLINTVYFINFEEPGLASRFGNDYLEYKKNVHRWIPKIKPWSQR